MVVQGDEGRHQPHHPSLPPLPRTCKVGSVSLLLIRQAIAVPQRTQQYHRIHIAHLLPQPCNPHVPYKQLWSLVSALVRQVGYPQVIEAPQGHNTVQPTLGLSLSH